MEIWRILDEETKKKLQAYQLKKHGEKIWSPEKKKLEEGKKK